MAESNNLIFEAAKSHLDENENPSLLGFNTTVGESKISIDSETFKTDNASLVLTKNVAADVSLKTKCLTPTKSPSDREFQSPVLENRDVLSDVINNSLSESLNNNLANGTHESDDISSVVPGPNFMENSPYTNEEKSSILSKGFNLSALSDNPVTKEAENSFEFHALEPETNFSGTSSDNMINVSALDCSALSEKAVPDNLPQSPAIEHHAVPLEQATSNETFEFPEPANLIGALEEKENFDSGMTCFPNSEDNLEGEEFQDAVQFFKDPNSLQFLENIQTSEQEQSLIPRDSLYMNFDPLHKNFVQPSGKPELPTDVSDLNAEADLSEKKDEVSTTEENVSSLASKHAEIPVRESLGYNLLSFDSPMKSNSARSSQKTETSPPTSIPRLYTEEELQQALKIHELTIQETYLKKQREMDEEALKKIQDKDKKIESCGKMARAFHDTIEELLLLYSHLKQENESLSSKVEELQSEKEKLDTDLKTSSEDLQSVEHTFSDFHKRYVQCKDMLKTYKDNEDRLKEQVEGLNKKLEEQEQMYDMLQAKSEEMVERANIEVANAKKGGEAQIAVLKAQLKKSELKVSSLESDIKQVRIENDKLSGICDDLMAKVSGS